MELLTLKLIVLGLSGGMRLFFGLVPLILFRSLARNVSGKQGNRILKYVISVLMFFGGGVLLATCFLHMMPEVRASFASVPLIQGMDLPVPELIFIGGFFLVYLLEEAVHGIIHRRRRKAKNNSPQNQIESETGTKNKLQFQQNQEKSRSKNEFYKHHHSSPPVSGQMNGVNRSANGIDHLDFDGIYGRQSSRNGSLLPRIRSTPTSSINVPSNPNFCQIDPEWWRDTVQADSQMTLVSASGLSIATLDEIPLNANRKSYGVPMTPTLGTKGQSSPEWSPSSSSKSDHDDHSHIPLGVDDESVAGAIRNLLIVVAISFHGVFEGLAIGLQGTEKDVWALFIAVSLHECTILFCIGVELISAQTKVIRMITYITVVSFVSPLGIAIGILISEHSVAGTVAQTLLVGSLQGLAAGTLLYVTFFEIFAAEGRKLHSKFIHILVAIIGFVMMASLEFLGGHGHGHGGGGGGIGHGHSHGRILNRTGGEVHSHGEELSHGSRELLIDDDRIHDQGHDHQGHVH